MKKALQKLLFTTIHSLYIVLFLILRITLQKNRAMKKKDSSESLQGRLVRELNRLMQAPGAPRNRANPWATADAIGRELKNRLDRDSDRRIETDGAALSKATLKRRKDEAREVNSGRARVFARDLKNQGLVFMRAEGDGRREIDFLHRLGVIRNRRDARHFGPARHGGQTDYIAVRADRISLEILTAHMPSPGGGGRLGGAFEGAAQGGGHTIPPLGLDFIEAAFLAKRQAHPRTFQYAPGQ